MMLRRPTLLTRSDTQRAVMIFSRQSWDRRLCLSLSYPGDRHRMNSKRCPRHSQMRSPPSPWTHNNAQCNLIVEEVVEREAPDRLTGIEGWIAGVVCRISASDFHFVERADAEDGAAKILQIVRERIPERYGLDPIRDIQVLCPTNRGDRSISICSRRFAGRAARERFGSTYGIGDKGDVRRERRQGGL